MIKQNQEIDKTAEAGNSETDPSNGEKDPTLEQFIQARVIKNKPVRYILIGTGCVSLGLALLGIPLPVLPTTPFLLVSAWCFGRSSHRLLRWLMTNRLFGEYLRNYCENKGIPKRVKTGAISLMWITILLSAFLVIEKWPIRILLLAIAVGVTIHILRVPTKKEEV